MKKNYRVGEDFFIAVAFMSFLVGMVLKILSFGNITFFITTKEVMFLAMICLLFSISLSLYDATINK